jgi:Flp pilus assembly protein TadD
MSCALSPSRKVSLVKLTVLVSVCLLSRPLLAADHTGPGQSVQDLRVAIFLHPNDPQAHDRLGLALATSGQWAEAVKQLQTAVWMDPTDADVEMDLADVLTETGDIIDAQKRYTDLLSKDPDNVAALIGLAETYSLKGQDQQSTEKLEEAEQVDPMDYRIHSEIAEELLGRHDYSGAATEFQYCLCLKPEDIPSLCFLATCLTGNGENAAAESVLQGALAVPGATASQLAQMYVQLGALFLEDGRTSDAVTTLRTAMDLTPSDPQVHVALGAALWTSGDKREADVQWRAALGSGDADAKETAKAWLTAR